MSKLGIAKLVVNYAVGSSAAYCVSNVISNATDPQTTEEKIQLTVGSIVIGSMVANQARAHVNNGIDQIVDVWQNRKTETATAE
jgi:hypothetical protein